LPIVPGRNPDIFGMATPAGSGRHLDPPQTQVIEVTNLDDAGPGSLRAALAEDGPTTIVFEVSGTITLESSLNIGAYTTVAGQTAPSPGITLRGNEIHAGTDVLVQHIRVRVGDDPDGPDYNERDALKTGASSRNVVFDHCSFSWSVDELADSRCSDCAFTHNVFAEALHSPLHPKGPHSRALLAHGYSATENQNVAIIGNLFVHNMTRNPSVLGFSRVLVVNNLLDSVNAGLKAGDSGDVGLVTFDKNVIKRAGSPLVADADNTDTRIYFGPDNEVDGSTFASVDDIWASVSTPFGGVPDENRASSPPVWISSFTPKAVDEVEAWVLERAGARPSDRDSVDARVVEDVKNGTGGVIASQAEVGGWPSLAENQHTLAVPANANELQPSGYTALEEWLHEQAEDVEAN